MTRYKNILCFTAAAALLVGCDGTSTAPLLPGEEPVEVFLTARIARTAVTVTTTKAGDFIENGETFPDQAAIGVYGLRDQNDPFQGAHLENTCFTAGTTAEGTGNAVALEGPRIYFPSGTDRFYLYGYYPYTGSPTYAEDGAASIGVCSSLIDAVDRQGCATDPLYTGATETLKNTIEPTDDGQDYQSVLPVTQNLNFRHALARLQLTVKLTEETPQAQTAPTLQSIRLTFAHSQRGQMNVADGTVTPETNDEATVQEITGLTTALTTTGYLADHTVLPAEDGIQKIEIQVDDQWFTAYERTYNDAIALTAGTVTNVVVTYNPSVSTTGNITDWNEDGSTHEYPAVTPTDSEP